MSQALSDFRSDTVTKPSQAMREMIATAEVGDDVLDGDPTVRALQEFAADWLGKGAALYVPSGTMANQIAMGSWTRPGDEIIAEETAHVVNFEGGATGFLHGLQTRTLRGTKGVLTPEEIQAAIQPDSVHCPKTALVCLEQTHMSSGGRVQPLEALQKVHRSAYGAGIPVHMDGARLGNAVAASGIGAREWAACADSVSLCLSKGLGAPVGSIIAGDGEFIERAARVRKRLGGWWRQAGLVAAAGLYALKNNVERLSEDHALAKDLAERLNAFDSMTCEAADVETNLILVALEHPDHNAASLCARLGEEGVLVLPLSENVLRFVTHMDVGEADVLRLQAALTKILCPAPTS
jgi:threonine aldolase